MRKKIGRTRKAAGALVCLALLWMLASPTARALRALPQTYRIAVGQSCALEMGAAVLSSQDETLLSLENNTLSAREQGAAEVTVNLFGLFPIGRMRVDVGEDLILVPGGQAVGVALATKGVLVVGVSDVKGLSPAREAGLRAGDLIESVNGQPLESSDQLTALVASSQGAPLSVVYTRDGVSRSATLNPRQASAKDSWRIGAWVRDSTAGVGTLSYYNPADQSFGALGHGITDGDTGKLLPVRLGSLFRAEIVDVRRGQKGTPGELRGSFLRQRALMGEIEENTALGIYGHLQEGFTNPLYPDGLPVGYQESVVPGPATILSTIDGNGIRAYSVEIVQTARQLSPAQKSMVIRVTDPVLLEKTGGIVQGMSGSPILQNGRIVGAVTHVFVDDPTRGYGLYIEWMLQTAQEMDDAA